MRRRESPERRVNPSGKVVWRVRWTDKAGRTQYGYKPDIPGTAPTKREAQALIDECYRRDEVSATRKETVGGYAASWLDNHPRSRVSNSTHRSHLNAVLDVKVDGAPFKDWPFDMLRRRHARELVTHMLVVDGRARSGVNNVLGSVRAMIEDAIDDEYAVANPFRGVTVRANDPRIKTKSRPIRVYSWEQMHAFARAAAEADGYATQCEWRRAYAEPMIRLLSDCGVRIGETFPLYVTDFDPKTGVLQVRWTLSRLGEVLQGTKTDHGEDQAGREVPVPPVLAGMLERVVASRPTPIIPEAQRDRSLPGNLRRDALMFPKWDGRVWSYASWWRDVLGPARRKSGMVDARPHEFRHSWVSHMRAAGLNAADVADVAGHTEQTATARYSHPLRQSFEGIRRAVGE